MNALRSRLGLTRVRGMSGSQAVAAGVLALGLATAVFYLEASSYREFIFDAMLLAVIGASALNLLMGTVGQVSIGNAAFLVLGAFVGAAAGRSGIAFPLDVVVAMTVGTVAGLVVGLPGLRIRGVYLSLTTLAAHFIFVQAAEKYQSSQVGAAGFVIKRIFTGTLEDQYKAWSIFLFVVVAALLVLIRALTTGRLGRAWRLIRDHDNVAPTFGIPVARYKLAAFMISSALISLQGGLLAHFSGYVSSESFDLALAISYVAMVLIGGSDSQLGSVLGAAIVIWLPYLASDTLQAVSTSTSSIIPRVALIAYGALIVFFITYSSGGVAGWLRDLGRWLTRPARTGGTPA